MWENPIFKLLLAGIEIICLGWALRFPMLLGVVLYSLIRGGKGMVISIIIFSCE